MSTKLIDAVRAGNKAECKRLLKLKDIDIHERDKILIGRSAIIWASIEGRMKIIKLLLSKGANVNDKDNHGYSVIILASYEGHMNVAELLLSKGANVNDKDNDGRSSIIEASDQGHVSVVELLLSKGANIHDISNDGFTAMSVTSSDKIRYILSKWPITMAILILKELDLYYLYDASTLIDLYQYLG